MIQRTGGFQYHWRAFRYRESLWSDFRQSIAQWLGQWSPEGQKLLLIGPSGGHCMDAAFVSRFQEVVAVDPDPLAKLIFRRRFGKHVHWDFQDYLSPENGKYDPARFKGLLRKYPDHVILFCNFLGQLRFLDEKAALGPTFAEWKHQIRATLHGRTWASFHDRLSGEVRPRMDATIRGPLSNRELAEKMYFQSGELLDHLTEDLFDAEVRNYFCWELIPGNYHLIEAVQSSKNL